MKPITIHNLKELKSSCQNLVQMLQKPQLVLLEGPLAVGKTQMVRYMAELLNCETEHICSPTFSLINVYKTKNNSLIYHADFYRLKTLEEIDTTHFWDILTEPSIIFIEWPQLVKTKLPPSWNKLSIYLSFSDLPEARVLKWESVKST